VSLYNTTIRDTYKVTGAMYTELDRGVAEVVAALKDTGMWPNTLVVFVSDNGGPLSHTTNYPHRGGKWQFWEGGVRVRCFVSGPVIPAARRGAEWGGLAHHADWYRTLVEGVAGATLPNRTGVVEPDSFNLWHAVLSGGPSPRQEVVHQVENRYFTEGVKSIRIGSLKLIVGNPSGNQLSQQDSRVLKWPDPAPVPVPLGQSGAIIYPHGSDHVYAGDQGGGDHAPNPPCKPYCLFNLTADASESFDLANDTSLVPQVNHMLRRLQYHGNRAPPPAYLWTEAEFETAAAQICKQALERPGRTLQPIDAA